MTAKQEFLETEGDAWYARNRAAKQSRNYPDDDRVLNQILELSDLSPQSSVLEIGCGGGERLAWLQQTLGYSCSGIEPSAEAVAQAQSSGIEAVQGTADQLPYPDLTFDLVIFGFCLYLCDRSDLFRIASEADRVLKTPGWMIVYDFYAETPIRRPYHHAPGLYSYKMDYRTLFTWHPGYTCYKHELRHHATGEFTNDPQEWVALSVLRKDMSRYG